MRSRCHGGWEDTWKIWTVVAVANSNAHTHMIYGVCVCMCIYIYMYLYMCVCVINKCIYLFIYVCIYLFIYAPEYAYICVYIYILYSRRTCIYSRGRLIEWPDCKVRRLKAEVMHAQESGPAPGRSIPKFGLSNGENYDKPRGAVGVPYFQTNPTDYQEKIRILPC